MKIAGIIVLYNPNIIEVKNNIETYINQVEKLYIIDNSDNEIQFIENNDKIFYFFNNGNQGIANALNKGIQFAKKDQMDWVLLIDQDSCVHANFINTMISFLENNQEEKIGILSPDVKWSKNTEYIINDVKKTKKVFTAITSGSLLNLDIIDIIGFFEEFLFIDWVDIDYCLRINLSGYCIIQIPEIYLTHQLGDCEEIKIFGKHIAYIYHHVPLRKYYITRNLFYMKKKYKKQYPEYYKKLQRTVLFNIFKIVFFEKNKIKKIRASYLGYIDYKNNIFGKIDEKKQEKIEK